MARGSSLFNFGTYTFASWARRGAANAIMPEDAGLVRARFPLSVKLNEEVLTQPIELLGPADVSGILNSAVVRTEPLDRNFNFEWNMLPYIEFYDEDFAWRYSPEPPSGVDKQLRPWLALLVLKVSEFVELPGDRGALTAIKVQSSALPLSSELSLWAHMHTGEYSGVSGGDISTTLLELGQNFAKDPDGFTCRLLSSRRLDKRTMYHAFLVPSYESGRLSGLGEKFASVPARMPAWQDVDRPLTINFPVYYRWSFATTEVGFEELVSKMKAGPVNPAVGIRDMDTSKPGYVKPNTAAPVPVSPPAVPVMGLEGALRTVQTKSTSYLADGKSDGFQKDISGLLDLYDKSLNNGSSQYAEANMVTDPVLSIPLYGHPYAKPKSDPPVPVPRDGLNWYSAMNVDPRNRVAAGLGTQVIQKDQETLMQTAWFQLKALQEARNQFAAVGSIMERARVRLTNPNLLDTEDFVGLARNMMSRIKDSSTASAGKTVLQTLTTSSTPNALVNSASRRVMRPNGNLVKRFKSTNAGTTAAVTLKAVNNKLTDTVLTNFRFKFRVPTDVFVVVPGTIVVNAPPPTPFDLAFDDLNARITSASIASRLRFPFDTAQKAISDALVQAPAKLMRASFNLPSNAADPRALVVGPAKPPAEFLGRPLFTTPMYEPLWKLDKDWLLPNIGLIDNNSISLLETNPHFINSYMVGLNQEMGREMLWREFPADLTATFFRSFWQSTQDMSVTPEYDILPIEKWLGAPAEPRASKGTASKLVLTIRGELLHKFPNTVVLAAKLQRDATTGKLVPPVAGDFLFPSFSADIPPDLKFLGFDILVSDIMTPATPGGSAKPKEWYFIFIEPIGEPRFGLDEYFKPGDPAVYSRNDLSWEHLKNPGLPDFITAANKPSLLAGTPAAASDNEKWGKTASAMAAMLFQQPYALIVKASDLLTITN